MLVLVLGVTYVAAALAIHAAIWLSALSTRVSERLGIDTWSQVVYLTIISFLPVVNFVVASVMWANYIDDSLNIPLHKE